MHWWPIFNYKAGVLNIHIFHSICTVCWWYSCARCRNSEAEHESLFSTRELSSFSEGPVSVGCSTLCQVISIWKAGWGTCSCRPQPHVSRQRSSDCSSESNPLQKHNFILPAPTVFFHSAAYLGHTEPGCGHVWSRVGKWRAGWCASASGSRY